MTEKKKKKKGKTKFSWVEKVPLHVQRLTYEVSQQLHLWLPASFCVSSKIHITQAEVTQVKKIKREPNPHFDSRCCSPLNSSIQQVIYCGWSNQICLGKQIQNDRMNKLQKLQQKIENPTTPEVQHVNVYPTTNIEET